MPEKFYVACKLRMAAIELARTRGISPMHVVPICSMKDVERLMGLRNLKIHVVAGVSKPIIDALRADAQNRGYTFEDASL